MKFLIAFLEWLWYLGVGGDVYIIICKCIHHPLPDLLTDIWTTATLGLMGIYFLLKLIFNKNCY